MGERGFLLSNEIGISAHFRENIIEEIAIQLGDPSLWIERRVESLSFIDDGSTRRRLSFDYIVQSEFAEFGYVPLATFRKENLTSLDVRGADGNALSILTSLDTSEIAVQILLAGIRQEITDEIQLLVEEMIFFKSSDTDQTIISSEKELYSKYVALVEDKDSVPFLDLAATLLRTFILWVKLPKDVAPLDRLVTKVSYEETLPFEGIFPPLPIKTVIHPNWSSRFHFEVAVPTELKVTSLTIGSWQGGQGGNTSVVPGTINPKEDEKAPFDVYDQLAGNPLQVAHISMDGYPDLPPMHAVMQIVPSLGGITKIASMVSFVTMVVFAVPTFFKSLSLNIFEFPKNGTAAPLLLLGPALLVAFLARSPEHPIVAHRLKGARYSLLFSGALLMAAATMLSGIVAEGRLKIFWYVFTGIAVLAWLVFILWRSMLKVSFLDATFMLETFKKV